jgi:hypothetical protein
MQIPNKVTSSLWKGDDQCITSNITTECNINFLCSVHKIKAQRSRTSDENFPEKFKSENFPEKFPFFYNDSWYG